MHVRFNSNQLHGWVSQDDLSSSDESCTAKPIIFLEAAAKSCCLFLFWGENADNNNQYPYLR